MDRIERRGAGGATEVRSERMPAVIDVRPRSSPSAVAHVVRWSGWAVVAVSGGRILFFPAVPPVAIGFFLALLLVAPFVPFERAIARVKAGDPERPAIIPLVYAFHTSGVAVLLYVDDAGPTAGICTTMALVVAIYGAIGRRAHLMLAVASVLLVPLLLGDAGMAAAAAARDPGPRPGAADRGVLDRGVCPAPPRARCRSAAVSESGGESCPPDRAQSSSSSAGDATSASTTIPAR